ncbi:MAG: hypothetical protein ABI707_12005 [Ferruginibacter sp.]
MNDNIPPNDGSFNKQSTITTSQISKRKTGFFKIFYIAFGFYCLPLLLLLIYEIRGVIIRDGDKSIWMIALIITAPCAIIGIIPCTWGLIKSFREQSKLNKTVGFIGLFAGLGILVCGIFVFQ